MPGDGRNATGYPSRPGSTRRPVNVPFARSSRRTPTRSAAPVSTTRRPRWPTNARSRWWTRPSTDRGGVQRGEIWLIDGARERLGLVISSDVYNGTDVPVVLVAEVVDRERLRDSPLAV